MPIWASGTQDFNELPQPVKPHIARGWEPPKQVMLNIIKDIKHEIVYAQAKAS